MTPKQIRNAEFQRVWIACIVIGLFFMLFMAMAAEHGRGFFEAILFAAFCVSLPTVVAMFVAVALLDKSEDQEDTPTEANDS